MAHHKTTLAEKICPVCDRPFSWRKKWAKCWEEVRYCSERCRRNRPKNADNSLTQQESDHA
ncbi:DUF2256 domain-containing protein [Leucothrix pacifica]|uniref:DUF2256 domain-containing protein n=1 Tax=Leucothrix pacifica TaxID=1247513 RepID=A0A317CCQ7_9GAMM|nr:DUF2256 domain-containing protein [Leucothrix pacifica]PWQ95133.1 DUF2256 domain-containing protein [Leucothrix pacifica]